MIAHIRLANALRGRLFRVLLAHRFGNFGRKTIIIAPIAIQGPERIHLGDDVYVAAQTCLAAEPHTGGDDCRLEIGDGCRIGRFNHIYATRRVVLGTKVLTANNVYISDNVHGYREVSIAVMDHPVEQLRDVEIGEGSWLGHNACVLGVKIGRHCVVGANAVVTRDLPDYSVAVGAPAIVIRRFDEAAGAWRKTRSDGSFIDQTTPAASEPA
jgi:acetyltransferase-like isoleucine patch superfamily enzyme